MSIKVITGKVRASFVHVFEPQSINGSEPKYSCSLIIPKSDTVTVGKIREAIEQAKQEGVPKWGGKIPPNLKLPLRDGDVDRPEDPAYADSYFINATSQEQPGVVDRKRVKITDPLAIYSGCYIRASINFYPFNANGNRGIAAGLSNIQFWEDGEPLMNSTRWTMTTRMISSTDAIRTPRISNGARLLDLLLQFIENRTIEKFPKGDFQSVAYLMNGNDTRIVAFLVKHTVNR